MKTKVLKILLIGVLLMLSALSKASCEKVILFKENYLNNFQKDEVFFIKGVALDVFEYGRTIEVIEDLKGNFTDESSIFVWGDGHPSPGSGFFCISNERMDNIIQYNENDTLIMLVKKPYVHEGCFEDLDDYATFPCAFSVLELSNGFVTGYIYPPLDPELLWEENIILWEELQEELLNLTAIQSVKIKNNIYQWDGTIFFENQENKDVKLSFYDLSGRLVYEIMTTSNSYRPSLTGNIYVCKINIDNELLIIKYIAQ